MQQNIDVLRARLDEIETGSAASTPDRRARLDEAEQVRWDELDAELKQLRQELSDAEAAQGADRWPSPAPSGAASGRADPRGPVRRRRRRQPHG